MVRAILEGRKTQTRRVVKQGRNQSWLTSEMLAMAPSVLVEGKWAQFTHPGGGPLTCVWIPYPIGTRLWVRETFATRRDLSHVEYRADRQEPVGLPFEHIYDERTKWRPSIFMPRRLSRINLLVTRVRCQRLQEITEEDAIAEGVDASTFPALWGVINEKRGFPWASNPWVWVYTFERILE